MNPITIAHLSDIHYAPKEISEVANMLREKNIYVENLLKGMKDENYNIDMFVRNHDHIDDKLTELKNIIIKYYPDSKKAYLMNAVLFDIYNCEKDLASHNAVEDYLFVPAVLQLEKDVTEQAKMIQETEERESTNPEKKETQDGLSQREKEIITCVVKGLSNKEIADQLFISIHTVITHRRNIARKLQIHSPTLLTVYAIVNKLVDISEVKVNL